MAGTIREIGPGLAGHLRSYITSSVANYKVASEATTRYSTVPAIRHHTLGIESTLPSAMLYTMNM